MDEVPTPEGISEAGDSDKNSDGNVSLDFEEKRRDKKYESYLVRLRKAPVYKRVKNKFDNYLTKTAMKAIEFSENKKRWQSIIDSDLYSKTPGRGIPVM